MTMTTSSVYVHLQRPDNGEWVTVGRYALERADNGLGLGTFKYAPSYLDAGHPWAIDPMNLAYLDDVEYPAPRYNGLIDVLRDITPDSWGKLLLKREYNLGDRAHDFDYLLHAGNGDRWGALTVSTNKKPSKSNIASPKMPKLEAMLEELLLMSNQQQPKDAELRKRLMKTLSTGGARPKATVKDGDTFWIVKPTIRSDVNNTALLEHACMQMGIQAGLNIANTRIYQDKARTAVLVERFDRTGDQRHMVLSGASLLQTEYPAGNGAQASDRWSYPLLAQSLRTIGVPSEDLRELFGRMIFNALIGNDDDHPRNHAIVWSQSEKKWRLSPAFDVVPNLTENPTRLSMQLSQGRYDITAESLFSDWRFFGFTNLQMASDYSSNLILSIEEACHHFETYGLSVVDASSLRTRIQEIIKILF